MTFISISRNSKRIANVNRYHEIAISQYWYEKKERGYLYFRLSRKVLDKLNLKHGDRVLISYDEDTLLWKVSRNESGYKIFPTEKGNSEYTGGRFTITLKEGMKSICKIGESLYLKAIDIEYKKETVLFRVAK